MRHLKLALVIFGLTVSTGVQAAITLPFSSLYVFGDSLVDSGNARDASLAAGQRDPAPMSAGYFSGRFSNGLNFADDLSLAISGTPATAYLEGGRNFAVGGALAAPYTTAPDPRILRPFSFSEQLDKFTMLNQRIAGDALVLVTFGGNDVRATNATTGDVDLTATTDALRAGLRTLVDNGARNIVVTGLADIGTIPESRALADQTLPGLLTERSIFLNGAFRTIAQMVGAETGANLQFFNLLGFEQQVTADPAAYGLGAGLNTTATCQSGGPVAVLGGCQGYLYFDDKHPTAAVHRAIAEGIAALPEPQSWAMLVIGLGMIGGTLRRTKQMPARARARIAA